MAEVVGGWLSNSLALMSDAGHMLTDLSALGLSLLALYFAARPADPKRTYGYYRAEILSALFNAYMSEPAQLPREVRQRAEVMDNLARAVCDYIAGMTDRYALDEHSKLFDPYTLP